MKPVLWSSCDENPFKRNRNNADDETTYQNGSNDITLDPQFVLLARTFKSADFLAIDHCSVFRVGVTFMNAEGTRYMTDPLGN